MSFLKKVFPDRTSDLSPPASTHFKESEPDSDTSPSAPRRDILHMVLRDTMRHHGIPSDWIDCRILTVISRSRKPGIHLTLIVRGGQDRLLAYVPAFQASFREALFRFEPRAPEWLLSLSWQFEGLVPVPRSAMPDPASWTSVAGPPPPAPAPLPTAQAGQSSTFANTSPMELSPTPMPPTPHLQPDEGAQGDELQQDLQALLAITGAALSQPVPPAPGLDRK